MSLSYFCTVIELKSQYVGYSIQPPGVVNDYLFVCYAYSLLFSSTITTDASSKDRWKSVQENLEVVTGILIGNFSMWSI